MAKVALRNLFTESQHKHILDMFRDDGSAAKAYAVAHAYREDCVLPAQVPEFWETLSKEEHIVSRQLVRFWRKIYMGNGGKVAKAKKQIIEQRKLIKPSPTDDEGYLIEPKVAHRIMVIGDTHAPYTHPDALEFLSTMKKEYNPDICVHMGDETDGHALSFHDSDPNLDSAGVELERAKDWLNEFYKIFPEILVCDSNHGSLIYRRAKTHGLPIQYLKRYRDILFPKHGAPGWSWADAWVLQTPLGPVRFQHLVSGDFMLNAAHERTSLVLGHEHGRFEVQYAASQTALYFGAYAGCLIDAKSMAFAYGRMHRKKPLMGCMFITEGAPQLVPMLVGEDGRWVGRTK